MVRQKGNENFKVMAWLAAALALFAGLLGISAPLAHADGDPEHVVMGHDLTVKSGETLEGDVSVTGGSLFIEGKITGDAVVVNGNAVVSGEVGGDVVVTGGNITLKSGSKVGGNVVYVGGELARDAGSSVQGELSSISIPLDRLGDAVPGVGAVSPPRAQGGLRGPFDRLGLLVGLGIVSLGLVVLSIVLLLAFPQRLRVSGATLEAEGGPSVIVGLITAGLLGPLTALLSFLLMMTVVGWVFVPVLVAASGGVLVFGLVTVSMWLGRRVYNTAYVGVAHTGGLHSGQTGVLEKVPPLMFQMLLGLIVLLLSAIVPAALMANWIGWVMLFLLYVAACLGLGAALLSRFGTLMPRKGLTRSGRPIEHFGAGLTAPLGQLPGRRSE
jgi:hypothetical protein